jgi:hypothetical protein
MFNFKYTLFRFLLSYADKNKPDSCNLLFFCADTSYDYAVPEMGTMPLLSPENTLPLPLVASAPSDKDSVFSKGSSSKGSKSEDSKGKKVS